MSAASPLPPAAADLPAAIRPLVEWFAQRNWTPFAFQREAWAAYLRGESGLVHAPTGVGKTYAVWLGPLAEYLWERRAIRAERGRVQCAPVPGVARAPASREPRDHRHVAELHAAGDSAAAHSSRVAMGARPTAAVLELSPRERRIRRAAAEPLRVLWLTPLRALAGDTVTALQAPLLELGLPWTVEGRTGDTSSSVRKRQRERLPTALVTTPESLTLMLSYPEWRVALATLRCIVVDEWHDLLSTKRGTQTELALARLRAALPHLRVWGLSATIGNLPHALEVLLGDSAAAAGPQPPPAAPRAPAAPAVDAALGGAAQAAQPAVRAAARLVECDLRKAVEVVTLIPPDVERFPWAGHLGLTLLERVADAVSAAQSSLLFTNTRSQAEIWFRALTTLKPDWLGTLALHHGSLDRKLRDRVEEMLKTGRARAVVCTASLDLGVDFAPVEQVFQLGSPKGVGRLLQRAGRSGHQPGAVSRVVCVPTHAFELLEFAAARRALLAREIEEREALDRPLDVLAQHLVTVAAGGGFMPDELFAELRTTYAYRKLSQEEFGWALDFVLRGGPCLQAYPQFSRIVIDEASGRYVVASKRLAAMHRMNIGTITADATMFVRQLGRGTLGTIEESFVAKLKPGDNFVFAGRTLEFVAVREMSAIVRVARRGAGIVPRWNGGRFPLSTKLGAAVREQMTLFDRGQAPDAETRAAAPLLELQRRWSRIPGPAEVLIERHRTRDGQHWFLFPFEGRSVHEGLSALLAYRLSKRIPVTLHLSATDYGFELATDAEIEISQADWRELLTPENLVADLLACVNCTQMARRQFRDIARIAGLILAGYPGQSRARRQLQASSDMFFDVFLEFDAHSLLLHQARREVLEQQLEINRLLRTLQRIAAQQIVIVTPERLTPLAFPVWAETLRAQYVSSEKWSTRVRKMAARLEAAARKEPRKKRATRPA